MQKLDVDKFINSNNVSNTLFAHAVNALITVGEKYDVIDATRLEYWPQDLVPIQQHIQSLLYILKRLRNHWRENRIMVAIVKARYLETQTNLPWSQMLLERELIVRDFFRNDESVPENVTYDGFLNWIFSQAQWGPLKDFELQSKPKVESKKQMREQEPADESTKEQLEKNKKSSQKVSFHFGSEEEENKEDIKQKVQSEKHSRKEHRVDPRKLTTLSGPSSFYFVQIPKLHQLNLLLLGEYHILQHVCSKQQGTEVQDWLWDLADAAPFPLDYFVEDIHGKPLTYSANVKSLHEYVDPINAIRHRFSSFRQNPSLLPKLSYHSIDVRQCKLNEWCQVKNTLLLFAIELAKRKIEFLRSTTKDDMIDYILGFDPEKETAFDDYIRLVYNMIYDEDIPDDKLKMFKSEILKARFLIAPYSRLLIQWEFYIRAYPGLSNLLFVLSLTQDIYVLGRLITEESIHFAIIYVGDTHTKFLIYLLTKLYPELRPDIYIPASSDHSQCLTLSKPFDLFQAQKMTLHPRTINTTRLITINVKDYHASTPSAMWEELKTYQPDLICTQEDSKDPQLTLEWRKAKCTTTEHLSNAIYSQQDMQTKVLNIKSTCPTDRCVTSVVYDHTIVIANVHLCGGRFDDTKWNMLSNVRDNQLKHILDSLHPDILVGDFNSEPNPSILEQHPEHIKLKTLKQKHDFKKYMQNGHNFLVNQGYVRVPFTEPTSVYGSQPDHIYYKPQSIEIKHMQVVPFLNFSDHNGLLIDFVTKTFHKHTTPKQMQESKLKSKFVERVIDFIESEKEFPTFADYCVFYRCLESGDQNCCDAYSKYLADYFGLQEHGKNVFVTILSYLKDVNLFPTAFYTEHIQQFKTLRSKIEQNQVKCENCPQEVSDLRKKGKSLQLHYKM